MDEIRTTIAIGKDKDPYKVPLSLIQLARYLQYIVPSSGRELKHIFDLMDLDLTSRRRMHNRIEFKTDTGERMKLQIINKALTMELFAGSMFGYIDHPSEVHSNCVVHRYQPQDADDDNQYQAMPSNFAQGGVPDVQVDYGTFMMILEVSSKSRPSLEHFRNQLEGALKHARAVREDGYAKPIYCLVIHERSLNLTENKRVLEKVLQDIKSSEQIFATATSIQEFAELGQDMAEQFKNVISKVNSDKLLAILQATAQQGIYGQFHDEFRKVLFEIRRPPSLLF
jgi:hypothetical protein